MQLFVCVCVDEAELYGMSLQIVEDVAVSTRVSVSSVATHICSHKHRQTPHQDPSERQRDYLCDVNMCLCLHFSRSKQA